MSLKDWVGQNGRAFFMGGLLLTAPPYRCTGGDVGGGNGGSTSAGTSGAASGGSAAGGGGGTETGGSSGTGGSSAGSATGGTASDTGGTAPDVGGTAPDVGGTTSSGGTAPDVGGTAPDVGGTTSSGGTASDAGGTAPDVGGTTSSGGMGSGGQTAGTGGAAAGGHAGGGGRGSGYDVSVPGVVTDNRTGLSWQQLNDGTYASLVWSDADAYCSNLEHAGFDDWRLPSAYELFTLIQLESGATNHHDLTVFPNSPADAFWSDGLTMYGSGWRNMVSFSSYFFNGFVAPVPVNADPEELEHFVRCVRGGAVPPPRFTDFEDGTVLDSATGLLWEQELTSDVTFAEAESRCASLSLFGGGWRLPTAEEVLSVVPSDAPLYTDSWSGLPLLTKSRAVEFAPTEARWAVGVDDVEALPFQVVGTDLEMRLGQAHCVR